MVRVEHSWCGACWKLKIKRWRISVAIDGVVISPMLARETDGDRGLRNGSKISTEKMKAYSFGVWRLKRMVTDEVLCRRERRWISNEKQSCRMQIWPNDPIEKNFKTAKATVLFPSSLHSGEIITSPWIVTRSNPPPFSKREHELEARDARTVASAISPEKME